MEEEEEEEEGSGMIGAVIGIVAAMIGCIVTICYCIKRFKSNGLAQVKPMSSDDVKNFDAVAQDTIETKRAVGEIDTAT